MSLLLQETARTGGFSCTGGLLPRPPSQEVSNMSLLLHGITLLRRPPAQEASSPDFFSRQSVQQFSIDIAWLLVNHSGCCSATPPFSRTPVLA